MWKCSFAEEAVDFKLLCLKMIKKAGIISVVTVLGAVLFGGIYFLKETVFSPDMTYQVVGETFIDYIPEEGYGISRVYITDEAWGSLAKSDDFVDAIMNYVSAKGYEVSAEIIRNSIDASVVTDSFVVTTTVYAKEEALAVSINEALQNAIVSFCADRQEVAESFIMTCPGEADRRSVTKEVMVAALLGAVLGFFAAVVAGLLSFLMDDSVDLPVTFEKRYGIPMLGTLKSKEFVANAVKLCGDMHRLAVAGVCEDVSTEEVAEQFAENMQTRTFSSGELQDGESRKHAGNTEFISTGTATMTTEWIAGISDAEGVILAVAAGRRDGKQIERVIDFLQKQGINIKAAVLCNADEALIARYYKPGIFKKCKESTAKKQAGDKA